jgi:hypothetical protein
MRWIDDDAITNDPLRITDLTYPNQTQPNSTIICVFHLCASYNLVICESILMKFRMVFLPLVITRKAYFVTHWTRYYQRDGRLKS